MQGKLIVLEGIDGSGKSTQFKLLTERLEKEGVPFRKLVFPRYEKSSSSLLRSYLSGEFGKEPGDVSAFAASTFFFVDRFASFKTDWGEYYNNGGTIICDRYTTSNAIHQGAKLPENELNAFLDWLYDFEFRLMELPKPDVVLYMDIDLETCLSQMKARQVETKTTGDIHETNADYLAACLLTGERAAHRLGWMKVRCLENGVMRGFSEIHEDVYNSVKGVLQ
ncbi:MAG: thymidylate kinase [Firmicutes bacterium HGW-Firmicutes-16]|nr:MAG: thymidylate kinase [Firmicutes bacterium HGW-Firmicutes-16]